jgi:hypothetical protein
MKKIVVTFFFSLIALSGFAQVAKGTGIFYFNGPPTLPVNHCYDGEVGIDTSSGYWYEYSRDFGYWIKAGFRVQLYDTCAKPTYIPIDKQSEVVLNSCDSLYRWRAGAWYLLNAQATGWTIDADDADTEVIINQTVKFQGAGITTTDYNPTTDVLLITSTEVDGSITNELQTIANTSDATSHTVTLSNSGGSVQLVEGANISLSTTGTGLDGVITIAASSGTGTDLSYSGTSSPVTLVSSSGNDVTFTQGGIVTITASGSNMTISATEVDGSITNELQTLANTSDATTHTVTLSNSGGSVQLVEGANISLSTTGTGLDGVITIAASSGTGTDLSYSGTSSPVTLVSSSGSDVTFTQGGIVTITASGSNMTISATEVDGSITNELQTLANTSNATSHTVTLSNSGGSVQLVEGTNVTLTTTGTGLDGVITIASTEVDGSVTNEAWTIDGDDVDTEVISNQTVKFQGAGITTTDYNPTTDVLLITSTEVDGSVSNELQTIANSSDATSHTVTLSNSGGSVQLVEGANVTLTTSGTGSAGIVTIAATEVDGSITNELQTLANTSDATSHTVTLSNSGGSVQLVEGTNVTLTTSGTGSAGIVTIAATEIDGSVTNEGILGVGAGGATSSVITSNTSGAVGVTVNVAGILSITETTSSNGGSITITGTEVDGSVTNEAWTIDADDADTELISSQTVKFQGAGITTTDYTPATDVLLITSTEVDGSITNELQTIANTSDATSHTVTLSNSGGSVQLVEGTNVTLTTTGTSGAGIVTIASTEVDGSVTNEAWTIDGDDVDTEVISNQTVKFQGAGITTTDYNPTTDVLLITSTEVDGSVTNELQTLANTSDATSHTVTLSNSGGTVQLVEGSNVTLTTTGTSGAGIVTISATEVDGSVTNEGTLGVSAGNASSSVITSNTSGAAGVTVNVAGILSITETTSSNGGSITITGTEVDGSVSNELQTIANTSDATSHTVTLSNAGGTVQLVEGANVTLTTTGTGLDGIVTISATEVDGSVTNELQTLANTSNATSHTVTLSNSGGSVQLIEGGIVTLSTTGTGLDGIVTISATEVDGSVTNEAWTIDADDTDTEVISNQVVKFQGAGITSTDYNPTTDVLLITSTEVDGSVSNELQTLANTSDATSHTVTLSNSGGSVQLVEGGIVTLTTTGTGSAGIVTVAATEVDGSVTNELQTLANTSDATSHTVTLSNSGGSVQLVEGGIVTLTTTGTGSAGIVTVAATEVDGSVTNEGTLGVGAGGATSSTLTTNTSGGNAVTVNVSGILSISESTSANGGSITITGTEVDGSVTNEAWTIDADDADTEVISNQVVKFQGAGITSTDYNPTTDVLLITSTEVDGSVTNELQTLANTSDATSHTVTLSNSGGSIQLVEGSNITLTTTGTGSAGIVTIASTAGGTDLSFTGASSPVTLNSSTGTDVTFTQGGIVTITGTSSNLTISATEVDGSVTNELQTIANTSNATSHTVTLSNSGGSVQLVEGGIVTLTTTGTGLDGIVTIGATEVDGSVTNEGTLGVGAGGATSSTIISNTSGATGVTVNVAGILSISESTSSNGGSITITGTEVDGSVTNELQTLANTSDATSHTVTLSNSGGSVQLVEGANVTLTTSGTGSAGIVTIASTAGGITAADNGLSLSGSTVKLGGPLTQAGTSIEQPTNDVFRWYGAGKWSVSSWTGFGIDPRNSKAGISGLEGSPTTNSTPTIDAILELNPNNSAGTIQSNSLAFGGYATDADGFWLQSRSGSNPSFEYPLSLQPRGGQLSVGRLTSLQSLVTFTGVGLTGSTATGSVLLLENSEGNGKTSAVFGSGSNNVTGELAMFHATDAFRITNRNSTNGTTSIRFALGGETSDVATLQKSSASTLVRMGVGTTSPGSTIQSAGSFGTAYLETVGAPTFDETKRTVIYTASTNITWTIPTAASCNCQGREYILHHAGTAGTITLSESVSKGNAGNFNTLTAGEWAYIIYGASSIRGYKLTSN